MAELDDSSRGDEAAERGPRAARAFGVVVRWETLLLVLLGGTIAYGAGVSPYFLQSTNLFFICLNVGEVAIMALPLTLIVDHRRDRPLGRVDARPARRADGRALQARLADLAGDDRGRRSSARSSARSTASSSRASACRRSR